MTSITARNAAALTARNGSTVPTPEAPTRKTRKTRAQAPTPEVTPAKAPAPTPAITPQGVACGCGCAATAKPGRTYLPGHDARHAGQVGRWLAANPEAPAEARDAAVMALPTGALRSKAERFAANRRAEATRKATAARIREAMKAQLKAELAAI